jgi:RNA 3'-terminal phosphate cyclase (ATP)
MVRNNHFIVKRAVRQRCAGMLTIDGSQGEGGGQILRSALALSLVTGQPFRIDKIRAGRRRPGLLRQHLTAVQAAAQIGQAGVCGASSRSARLDFTPGEVVPGEYHFDVGTAGSTTLVLQTVLPALLTATGPSRLSFAGGTHNPFAPPFDFLQRTFLPVIERMGPRVAAVLEAPGFYPAGGGRFHVTVEPVARLARCELMERGGVRRVSARAIVANLPRHIAERELGVVERKLGWPGACLRVEEVSGSPGPGNVLLIEVACEQAVEVFCAFGERGVRAELVAEKAVVEARRYLDADVPVGEYLADQLLLPVGLAGGGAFKTLPLSLHARTNIDVLKMFLSCDVRVEPAGNEACIVTVG